MQDWKARTIKVVSENLSAEIFHGERTMRFVRRSRIVWDFSTYGTDTVSIQTVTRKKAMKWHKINMKINFICPLPCSASFNRNTPFWKSISVLVSSCSAYRWFFDLYTGCRKTRAVGDCESNCVPTRSWCWEGSLRTTLLLAIFCRTSVWKNFKIDQSELGNYGQQYSDTSVLAPMCTAMEIFDANNIYIEAICHRFCRHWLSIGLQHHHGTACTHDAVLLCW